MREGSPGATSFPDVFAVYPNGFGLPSLLGAPLVTREVHASILGGPLMSVFRADRSALGSGELPWSLPGGSTLFDQVDIADLESESAHRYARLDATLDSEVMGGTTLDNGATVVDGGRGRRTIERFVVQLPDDGAAFIGVLRYASTTGFDVAVGATSFSVPPADLDEGHLRAARRARPHDAGGSCGSRARSASSTIGSLVHPRSDVKGHRANARPRQDRARRVRAVPRHVGSRG